MGRSGGGGGGPGGVCVGKVGGRREGESWVRHTAVV
jgi:hypothetical protein